VAKQDIILFLSSFPIRCLCCGSADETKIKNKTPFKASCLAFGVAMTIDHDDIKDVRFVR